MNFPTDASRNPASASAIRTPGRGLFEATMDDIEDIVRGFLSDTVAAHKRRVANRQGRREPVTDGCSHENWNHLRQWCDDCGITAYEIVNDTPPPARH